MTARLLAVAFIAMGTAFAAAPPATSGKPTVIRRNDGTEVARLVALADGGAETRHPDGGSTPMHVVSDDCSADAGTLFRDAARGCKRASDCTVFRPRVRGVTCCVAVRKDVSETQSFSRAVVALSGSEFMPDGGRCKVEDDDFSVCLGGCEQAACRKGSCVVAGQD